MRWALALLLGGGLSLATAPGARAAISFVSATSAMTPAAGASNLSLPKPAALAAGDVEIATIALSGSASITPPSGWTQIIDTANGGALHQVSYWHIAGATEDTSTWSFSATATAAGGIAAYSGVDPTTMIDAYASQTGSGTSATIPSLNAAYPGDMVLGVASFANSAPLGPSRGATKRYSAQTVGLSGPSILAQDQGAPAAGPTPSQTVNDPAAGPWVGQAIALKAADATGMLSVSAGANPSFSADLNAGDQTVFYQLPLSLTASISPPPGWKLSITSTQFSNGSEALSPSASQIASVTATCVSQQASCSAPVNSVTYPLTVPAGTTPPPGAKFFNAAAGSGAGIFTVTPTVQVFIPQNSYAGSYSATLTISIASGP